MTNRSSTKAETSHSQSIAKSKKTKATSHPRWQMLVISGANAHLPIHKNIRLDSSHSPKAPHLTLGWSQQIGWHCASAATPLNAPIESSTQVSNRVSSNYVGAPKFMIASKQNSTRDTVLPRSIEIEGRLLELAQRLVEDIRGPLADCNKIINRLCNQVKVNSYLSIDDALQLETVSRNLELITQWSECILFGRKIDDGGLHVVRNRFTPEQWRESIIGLLEAIARPKNIQINWIGWDTELPLLYLDSGHLTRAVLNLVANAIAASELGNVVNIRASWQHNVTGRLMITIEDNGIGLPPNLMKILNSVTANAQVPANGNGLQAARQLISGIGGLIAAQHGPHCGTIVRISLPVDNHSSLIRAWILQNATTVASNARYRVALFAVKSGLAESELFDSHLQKSATARQFVYRVADNRWLVLELKSSNEGTDSTLMAASEQAVPSRLHESQPWLSQSVFVSQPFALGGLLGRVDSDLRLPQLTEQLVRKFEELLGNQQQAISRLTINAAALIQGPTIPAPHFNRSLGSAIGGSNSNLPHVAASEPGFQTANEIVKQWKLVQAKLALLTNHPAVKK